MTEKLRFVKRGPVEARHYAPEADTMVVMGTLPNGQPRRFLGAIQKLDSPRVVAGQTMRWRAWFGGKWIDIPRRKDFARVYEHVMGSKL